MLAMKYRQEQVATWLLENGADINAETNDGKRALHFAIDSKFLSGGKLLLNKGASVTTKAQPDCASITDYAISRYAPYEYIEPITTKFNKQESKEIYFDHLALRDLARELVLMSVQQGVEQCISAS